MSADERDAAGVFVFGLVAARIAGMSSNVCVCVCFADTTVMVFAFDARLMSLDSDPAGTFARTVLALGGDGMPRAASKAEVDVAGLRFGVGLVTTWGGTLRSRTTSISGETSLAAFGGLPLGRFGLPSSCAAPIGFRLRGDLLIGRPCGESGDSGKASNTGPSCVVGASSSDEDRHKSMISVAADWG